MIIQGLSGLSLGILAVVLAGLFLTCLMLPGVWLVVVGEIAYELAVADRPNVVRMALVTAVAAGSELVYRGRPKRWRGSARGDRAIGLGAACPALLPAVAAVGQPLWTILPAVALAALAGATVTEYRRRKKLDDEDTPVYAPAAIVRRTGAVWLRVSVTIGLAACVARSLMVTS